jgi:hypothetical protein
MIELVKLIRRVIDTSVKIRLLKRIDKSLDKRSKIYQAYKREMAVCDELIKKYNERCPDSRLKPKGE